MSTSTSTSDSSDSGQSLELRGTVIDNRYVALMELGSGAYASVWLCWDSVSQKYLAMKVFNDDDPEAAQKECEIMDVINKIDCPVLLKSLDGKTAFETEIKTDDMDEPSQRLALCLPLMAGSLYTATHKNTMKLKRAGYIAYAMIKGLAALHEAGYANLDVKPENVLVVGANPAINDFTKMLDQCLRDVSKKHKKPSEVRQKQIKKLASFVADLDETQIDIDTSFAIDGRTDVVLSDFGAVLKRSIGNKRTRTVYYRSPEAILHYPFEDNATQDIWAVACAIWEVLTGSILFDPKSLQDIDENSGRTMLYLFTRTLGPIPDEILDVSKACDVFYTKDSRVLFDNIDGEVSSYPLEAMPLSMLYGHCEDLPEEKSDDIEKFMDFMYSCLNYDPKQRPTAKQLLEHPWLAKFHNVVVREKDQS